MIGCGESGVLAGVRLKQADIDFTIAEKNAGLGRNLRENSYPGARVDVANHFYCYSFEPSNHWDHFFAEQPELRQYFRDVVDRHNLEPHIRWNTEVVSAARTVNCGTSRCARRREPRPSKPTPSSPPSGSLNRPQIPDFPGAETFAGPAFTPRHGTTTSTSPASESP